MARSAHYAAAFCVLLISTAVLAAAQDLKHYPGSQLDEKASSEASKVAPGKESQVYTTPDAFDKVFAFYKSLYKQDTKMRAGGPKLPSGQQIEWAFFIIDGGSSLANSKYWMKVQHPYVGGPDGKDIRNLTIIQSVRTK